MATLLIEYRVDDISEWQAVFDADPMDRGGQGAVGHRFWRDPDDDRHFLVGIDFDSADQARAFRDLPAMQRVWSMSGAGQSWILVADAPVSYPPARAPMNASTPSR